MQVRILRRETCVMVAPNAQSLAHALSGRSRFYRIEKNSRRNFRGLAVPKTSAAVLPQRQNHPHGLGVPETSGSSRLMDFAMHRLATFDRWVPVMGIAVTLWLSPASADEPPAGQLIYQKLCAACHGKAGEGVASAYSNPLIGDRSIGELAAYIDKTMPEGEPEKCSAEEARQVAEYIHQAFYSPTAQARNQPARVELSRLTVRQYRQSVADLIESFRWSNRLNDQHGLKGEYFKNRRSRKEDREIERLDPVVKFDFGETSPDPAKLEPKEYFNRWSGGVFVPETGDYEFVVRSENSVKLWVNAGWETPTIDVGVKSGTDTEYRATMFLIGGRVYPLRLEHYKSREKVGTIELLWKPPHHELETIPARCLTPESFAESFVVTTPFPPDDRSVGYERGTSVSKAWDEAATNAALETSAYVVAEANELANTKSDAGDRVEKLKAFCAQFAERAFRRPLSDEDRKRIVDQQFAEASHIDVAVQRAVLLTLLSPRFLYRELEGDNDSYNVASRLSFALWDSIPDQQLRDAARKNELESPEQIRRQAERMVRDLRCEGKLREFLHQWLKMDHLHDVSKDESLYPDFTAPLVSDLRTSLDLSLDEVMRSETADFRQLLLSDALFLNSRLAKFYGAQVEENADFQKVALEPQSRAGVLSHPFLLAGFAYHGTSSPIHRGVFVARNILGRSLRTPPVAVAPLAPDLHADLTTRERVVLQTSPAMCQSCHSLINPLGFGLEHFDAVGRYRDREKGKAVDAEGSYITRSGREIKFRGVRELAEFLAADSETHAAFAEQLFQYQIKQPIRAFGPTTAEQLTKKFQQQGFHIRRLQVEIAAAAALIPDSEHKVTSSP